MQSLERFIKIRRDVNYYSFGVDYIIAKLLPHYTHLCQKSLY